MPVAAWYLAVGLAGVVGYKVADDVGDGLKLALVAAGIAWAVTR